MADEPTGATAPSAPNPIPQAAAPAAAPASAPASSSSSETPSAHPAETSPAAAVAPVSAAPETSQSTPAAAEAPPAAAAPADSLLGKAAEPPAEAAKDAPAPDAAAEQTKEDGGQSAEAAPLPAFEAFTVPEGIQVDAEKLGEFTKELAEFEQATKADHAELQKFGQKLMDRHIAEVQATVDRLNEAYVAAFEKQKSEWRSAFEKDPEIGGNRADTTVNAALQFIRTHGGNEAQQQEFRELMNATGIGNHPALIRLLAKANSVLSEGQPLPAEKPPQQPRSKIERRYGQTN